MDIDSIHHSEKEIKKEFKKEKDGHGVNMTDNVLNDKDTDPEQVARILQTVQTRRSANRRCFPRIMYRN